jgi:ribose 5-phosphate isomerase B
MRIALASDHGGFELKESLKEVILELGYDFLDLGTSGPQSVDYPDYGAAAGLAVTDGRCARGIVVCGTGIGISIAANKIPGVRAALVHSVHTAQLAAEHNNANILALGGRLLAPALAAKMVEAWLKTPFETRHQARLDMLTALEQTTGET